MIPFQLIQFLVQNGLLSKPEPTAPRPLLMGVNPNPVPNPNQPPPRTIPTFGVRG